MRRTSPQSGFTVVEILIGTAVSSAVGVMAYLILSTGLVLYTKNTSVNLAHQQARLAVVKMEGALHSSVSLPRLCDRNRAPVAGSGPAPGISFQTFAGGPFKVTATAYAGQSQIQLGLGTFQAKAGQRLIIPTHQIEVDLASASTGSGNRTLTLTSPLVRPVEVTLDNAGTAMAVNVIAFITDRVACVVTNNELRYYPDGPSSSYSVLATGVTEANPFSTPETPAGAPYYRFVAAVNLSTRAESTSNRGFRSANMFLNSQVPCRTRLCTYQ